MTKDRVIGKSGKLAWDIPEDMALFRKTTSHGVVVMGRKTYEAIGRPLPNRINIVISRSMKPSEGVEVYSSVEEAIEKAKMYNKDIFVIGGGEIYRQTLDIADKLYISWVKKNYEGDTYYPEFNEDDWDVVERRVYTDFEFVVYVRKKID